MSLLFIAVIFTCTEVYELFSGWALYVYVGLTGNGLVCTYRKWKSPYKQALCNICCRVLLILEAGKRLSLLKHENWTELFNFRFSAIFFRYMAPISFWKIVSAQCFFCYSNMMFSVILLQKCKLILCKIISLWDKVFVFARTSSLGLTSRTWSVGNYSPTKTAFISIVVHE